ncbi:hypothetical protein BKA93DRAFT_749057 [Sparassis latifolia]
MVNVLDKIVAPSQTAAGVFHQMIHHGHRATLHEAFVSEGAALGVRTPHLWSDCATVDDHEEMLDIGPIARRAVGPDYVEDDASLHWEQVSIWNSGPTIWNSGWLVIVSRKWSTDSFPKISGGESQRKRIGFHLMHLREHYKGVGFGWDVAAPCLKQAAFSVVDDTIASFATLFKNSDPRVWRPDAVRPVPERIGHIFLPEVGPAWLKRLPFDTSNVCDRGVQSIDGSRVFMLKRRRRRTNDEGREPFRPLRQTSGQHRFSVSSDSSGDTSTATSTRTEEHTDDTADETVAAAALQRGFYNPNPTASVMPYVRSQISDDHHDFAFHLELRADSHLEGMVEWVDSTYILH